MQKALSYLFLMTLTVASSVLAMIYGWGLQPKSWWWIIGVGIFFNAGLRVLIDRVMAEDKKTSLPIKIVDGVVMKSAREGK